MRAASAGHQVLHQHIGPLDQLLQHGACGRVLEVERQAFLGAVAPDEVRRRAVGPAVVGAGEVALARTLDLDDARTEVSELTRAERRGNRMLQRNDQHSFQWTHGNFFQNERGSPSTCSAT